MYIYIYIYIYYIYIFFSMLIWAVTSCSLLSNAGVYLATVYRTGLQFFSTITISPIRSRCGIHRWLLGF